MASSHLRHRFYEYYTTNGQASMPQVDNARYPSVHVETLRDFFGKHKLGDLSQSAYNLTKG